MDSRLKAAAGALDGAAAAQAPIAFDAVRDALSASYCLLFAERVDNRQVEASVVDGVDQAYGDRLQLAAAERLLPTWLRGLNEGIVVDRATLQRDHDFARSDFYNYVIRPEGRFHCLIATPHVTPARRYHLIVGRPAHASDFACAEVNLLRALLPHLARLIAVTNDAVCAASRSNGLVAAFDSLADNIAVVSGTGELQFANAGARRAFALRDGLSLAGTKLRAMHASATATLMEAFARVTAEPCDGEGDVALCLPRPSGCPPFQIRVRRIDAPPDGATAGGRSALLLIQQPNSQPDLNRTSLARFYGLTAREMELALLLTQGRNLRSAAGTLGMSYQTARFHLRNTFSKTDVHRQSDLIRVMLQASP